MSEVSPKNLVQKSTIELKSVWRHLHFKREWDDTTHILQRFPRIIDNLFGLWLDFSGVRKVREQGLEHAVKQWDL